MSAAVAGSRPPPYGQNYDWLNPGQQINPGLIIVLHFTQGEHEAHVGHTWGSAIALCPGAGWGPQSRSCPSWLLLLPAVVWADTRSMGCGLSTSCGANTYTVCQYYPPGNFEWCDWDTGQCWSYQENVFRTACQNATQNDGCSQCSGTGECLACYPDTRTYDSVAQTVRGGSVW